MSRFVIYHRGQELVHHFRTWNSWSS